MKTKKSEKYDPEKWIVSIFLVIFASFSLFLVSCTRSASDNKNVGLFPTPFAPSPDPRQTGTSTDMNINSATLIPDIELIETGFMGGDLMIFSLELSREMDKEYFGKVGEEMYECTRQEELTDRLYCFGHIPEDKQNPVFHLFSSDNEMIWETTFVYPDLDTP